VHNIDDRGVVAGNNDRDLRRANREPLLNQVLDHRPVAPGQQKFRLAHARGTARAENDGSKL
jgi:hypothetical protein